MRPGLFTVPVTVLIYFFAVCPLFGFPADVSHGFLRLYSVAWRWLLAGCAAWLCWGFVTLVAAAAGAGARRSGTEPEDAP